MEKGKVNRYYAVFFVLIIPIILFVFVYVRISPTIVIDEEISLQDLVDFFVETYSLFISIVLAIIVFKQEKKIKFLEESEYNVFIGIDSVETRRTFENVVFTKKSTGNYMPVSKTYIENEVLNYVCLDLSENISNSNDYLFHLRLISKNKLLLNYVRLTQLVIFAKTVNGVNISSTKKQVFEIDPNNNYISFCTCDNSKILLAIGVFMDMNQIVEQFELVLHLEVLDVSGNIHKLKLNAIVAFEDENYFLISSQTTEL